MRRLAVISGMVCGVLAAAGCGSSNAPTGTTGPLTGTYTSAWTGAPSVADTLQLTQSGTALTGTDVEHNGGNTDHATISGSVSGSAVNFTLSVNGATLGIFKGTFATATVMTGFFYFSAADSTQVSWTKE